MKDNNVLNILKQKYQPELYAAEQLQKDKEIAEMLAFVEGVKAALEQKEVKKALFITDDTNPCGFKPNK